MSSTIQYSVCTHQSAADNGNFNVGIGFIIPIHDCFFFAGYWGRLVHELVTERLLTLTTKSRRYEI